MCLYPKLIKNKKYIANKKNGGNVPTVQDPRTLLVPVGCGKCMECARQNQRAWQVRLQEEIKTDENGKFLTFTFSNKALKQLKEDVKWEKVKVKTGSYTMKNGKKRNIYETVEVKQKKDLKGYNLDNAIAKRAVRLFLERWRAENKTSVKHWLVTELGTQNTERIHLHGILFTNENKETIEKIWKYGKIWVGNYVNERTINYIVKYISKADEKHKTYKPVILTSSGIGKGYILRKDAKNNQYKGEHTKEYYRTKSGHKINLPIYYRNHIYNEEEKEKLWIYKLDKEERWVDGIKIDISKGEKIYYSRLKETQKLNTMLGYGDDKIDWKKRKYEEQRRNLKKMVELYNKN